MNMNKDFLQQPAVRRLRGLTTGYSLIEVLVSVAILSILSGVGLSIYAITSSSFSKTNAMSKIQGQGSQVVEALGRSIRSSSKATLSTVSPGSGQCPGYIDAGTTCQRLNLVQPSGSIDASQGYGCLEVNYLWIPIDEPPGDPTARKSGRLIKYYGPIGCDAIADANTPEVPIELFDSSIDQGVSIETISGNTMIIRHPLEPLPLRRYLRKESARNRLAAPIHE
jgi:prepilin-type N-terminal cleavage/methylation domain-containing protein